MKKVLLSLSMLALLTAIAVPAEAYDKINTAAESSTAKKSIEENQNKYVEMLAEYVIRKEDGTISLDQSYHSELSIPEEFVDDIQNHMNNLNIQVKEGNIVVNKDLSITTIKENKKRSNKVMAMAKERSLKGNVDIKVYWWGYGMWLDDRATRDMIRQHKAGVAFATLLAMINVNLDYPDSKSVTFVSSLIAWFLQTTVNKIEEANEGNGVLITTTNLTFGFVVEPL
ncbi:hypothetical protein E1B06_21920 [Brevibacillus laterosporus]|uniref:hypothetical protein n=1 Tax=Brevibacillus laterosporus TaxID=1465 RepID=UPI0024062E05|nr:hypothetical protein [Brevibacillus laterosporus]MDF9414292.1 hypothetical protein [Brevibacillus laterosporus]